MGHAPDVAAADVNATDVDADMMAQYTRYWLYAPDAAIQPSASILAPSRVDAPHQQQFFYRIKSARFTLRLAQTLLQLSEN